MRLAIILCIILFSTSICFKPAEHQNDEMTLDEFILLIRGLFEGMNIKSEMEEIVKCVNKVPEIANVIMDVIDKLLKLDFKNIKEIVELIIRLMGAVRDVVFIILPCASSTEEWNRIIEKLSKLDIIKIIDKTIEHCFDIMAEVLNIKKAIPKNDFKTIGKSLGRILYFIFLDEDLRN